MIRFLKTGGFNSGKPYKKDVKEQIKKQKSGQYEAEEKFQLRRLP